MKQLYIFLVLWFSAIFVNAGSAPRDQNHSANSHLRLAQFTINMFDTVVFDISQSVIAGNEVSFPVYFISDDTINALDFSLAYDETNFSLDTIVNLTTYLQPVYNFTMGTLYFTSYSLQDIDHNTPLISVHFNMLDHYLCSDDLNSILVYLNGDPCSVKVIECLSDETAEAPAEIQKVEVYPNPATGKLNIRTKENIAVELLDLNGSRVLRSATSGSEGGIEINISDLEGGIYLLKVFNEHFSTVKKIVIN